MLDSVQLGAHLRLAALIVASVLAGVGCTGLVYRAALPFLYEPAALPAERVVRDLPYRGDGGADALRHRLDLYLADGTGWPVLVFVHGGGWRSGDKGLEVGGADVYANIGRFFAARGIGVAVINYRLQPAVDWRAQTEDVARAVAWVHTGIGRYGGDPRALFVMGHSAGAQLATRVALDPAPLAALGLAPGTICGLIPVSGAAFDLADEETYALGASRGYYEQRFRSGDATGRWEQEASPLPFARGDAPPTLILYPEGEYPALKRQAALLDQALRAAGASSRVVVVPGESHYRIVLALSRPDKPATPAILSFVRERGPDCAARPEPVVARSSAPAGRTLSRR